MTTQQFAADIFDDSTLGASGPPGHRDRYRPEPEPDRYRAITFSPTAVTLFVSLRGRSRARGSFWVRASRLRNRFPGFTAYPACPGGGVSLAACVSVSLRFNRVVTASDSVDTSRMERPVLCACVGPQRTLLAPAGGWRCRSRPSGSGVAAVARFFIGFRYPLIYCRVCDGCCCVRHTLACRFVFVFPPTPLACPD